MFFVCDTQESKERKIRRYLLQEPMLAVLMAAANFEWTAGRCILFFSRTPNAELREKLARCHGLEQYKDTWQRELVLPEPGTPILTAVVRDWQRFRDAFELRHRLIHGRATCTRKMASAPVEQVLTAVADLYAFASVRGQDLHDRLPVRRRKRGIVPYEPPVVAEVSHAL